MQAQIAHMNDNVAKPVVQSITLEEFSSALQVMVAYLNAPHDTATVREVMANVCPYNYAEEPLYMLYDLAQKGWLYRMEQGKRNFYWPRGEALTIANQKNQTITSDDGYILPVRQEDYLATNVEAAHHGEIIRADFYTI